MVVQVQQPTRKKKDFFDILVGGLQAASAFTNIQKSQAELERIPEIQKRTARQEQQSFAREFQPVAEGTVGAVELEKPSGEKGLFLPRGQIIEQQKAKAKRIADADAASIQKQKDIVDTEDKLRKEFLGNPLTKITQDVSTAVGKIRTVAGGKPTAAGDLSLIFNYMKLLDPGSTVREGEFATVEAAAGIPTRVRNLYNKAMEGQRLSQDQRKDFATRAEQLYDVHFQRQKAFNDEFKRIAGERGVKPSNVVLDLKFKSPTRSLVPKSANQNVATDINILNQNLEKMVGTPTVTEQAAGRFVDMFDGAQAEPPTPTARPVPDTQQKLNEDLEKFRSLLR